MPHPTTTPTPWEVQVQSPWLTQGYSVTPTVPWYQAITTTSSAGTLTLPQVWTSTGAGVGSGYQVWSSGNTMTITIPASWGTTGTWDYQDWTAALNRPVEQLPAERGHQMSPIEMGRWLRRREEADQARCQEAEEMARLREEQAARDAAAAAERRREIVEAEERAEALLRTFLSAEQRLQYEREQAFVVRAPSGRRYRLRRKLSGNVDELDEAGNLHDRMCIHPYAECPLADVLICQLLMLRTNEEEFRATANHRLVA